MSQDLVPRAGMSRLLVAVWPFPTHLRPNLALASALREAGHDVRFYTGPSAQAAVEAAGFAVHPFVHVDDARVRETVDKLIVGRDNPWRTRRRWREFLADTVPGQVSDLEAIVRAWQPEAIVCDLALWAPMLVLHERDRIPVVAFSHLGHCLLPGPDGPIAGVALPRRRGIALEVHALAMRLVATIVTAGARRRASRLRQEYGLSPLPAPMTEFAGRMPLYLVPSVPAFDHDRRDLPASVHYVGPCLWPPPPEDDRHRAATRPLVIVEEGALFAREPTLLETAEAAARGEPWDLVVMPGEGRNVASFAATHPGTRVEQWTGFAARVAEASAVITTGNSESVLTALRAGVPLVVVPTLWDQAEAAWRVAECGAGLRVTARQCTAERLREAVRTVVHDATYRERAAEMRAQLRAAGGPARAAALISDLIARLESGHVVGAR